MWSDDLQDSLECLAGTCFLSFYKHVTKALNKNETDEPSPWVGWSMALQMDVTWVPIVAVSFPIFKKSTN